MKPLLLATLAASLLFTAGCSKKAEESTALAATAQPANASSFDVSRQSDTTPELVDEGRSQEFLTGTEGDVTIKSANFDIASVESSNVECAKVLSTKKVSAREVQLHLKFGKVDSDSQSCDLVVHPVKGNRTVYTYVRVKDTDENIAARAKAEEEKQQQEMAAAQQKMNDVKSAVGNVGKSWDVNFGAGNTEKWTFVRADYSAQFKTPSGDDMMLIFDPDKKAWMMTGGNCVYQVTMDGDNAKGKAAFCQKASRSSFTAKINR